MLFRSIFSHFGVPPLYQHRVLYWGILGALLMRGGMILGGAALISRFGWILYVFGAFLIFTAIRMLSAPKQPGKDSDFLVNLAMRIFPVAKGYVGPKFVVRSGGRLMLTPLALALIAVESADVVFAVDSIPAIFAITQDPFIVYTSNICAILGLRSLYFLLAGLMNRFIYLRTGLALVLGFVGMKMITAEFLPFPRVLSLGIVVLILGVTIWLSMLKTSNGAAREHQK